MAGAAGEAVSRWSRRIDQPITHFVLIVVRAGDEVVTMCLHVPPAGPVVCLEEKLIGERIETDCGSAPCANPCFKVKHASAVATLMGSQLCPPFQKDARQRGPL